ncbi:hypothetical protein ACWGQ2_15615 [Arthrobacter sp. NPDC055585]
MRVNPSFDIGGEMRFAFSQEILGETVSPLPSLVMHGHLRTLTGDRIAVASALLLGRTITERLKVGRPISQRVAGQIRAFTGVEGLDIPETTSVPLAVHTGSVELIVVQREEEFPILDHFDRRRMALREVPTHQAAGRLFTFEAVTVATNSWLFGKPSLTMNGNTELEAALAVPVLMAQDLSASKITIPSSLAELVDEKRLQAIARLLISTDLQLNVDGSPVHVR